MAILKVKLRILDYNKNHSYLNNLFYLNIFEMFMEHL